MAIRPNRSVSPMWASTPLAWFPSQNPEDESRDPFDTGMGDERRVSAGNGGNPRHGSIYVTFGN
jgi:hypothetical protein